MADLKLNNVRLSFPTLFEPKEFKAGDGKPRYSITVLIPKGSEQDKAIQAAIIAAAKESYGDKAAKQLAAMKGQSNKFCYLDGDLSDRDGYEGMMELRCHRRAADGAPKVFDRDRSLLSANAGRPYGGCYVNALVSVYAQKGENPGIRGSFSGVQFVKDGDAFATGKVASADDFEDVAEDDPIL